MKRAFALIVSLSVAAPAQAASLFPATAADLARMCDASAGFLDAALGEFPQCAAYIDGFVSAHQVMTQVYGARPVICLPSSRGVQIGDLIAAYMDHASRNPGKLSNSARAELTIALALAFPCSK